MKGIIFNVFEEVVRDEHGEQAWDDILDRAGVAGAYTSLGTYPDSELLSVAAAAGELLNQPPEQVVRDVGVAGLSRFALRYPEFLEQRDLRAFLLSLNSIIHTEVSKLYPGSLVPHFEFLAEGPDSLTIEYVSPRGLCYLAEGLMVGSADWYRESAQVLHPQCRHRGDPRCVFVVSGLAASPQGAVDG